MSGSRRSYSSALRTAQAERTRKRIVKSAAELFDERGYAGTQLRAVAERAGVSVQSVQLNGPKAALLLAALELVVTGDEGDGSIFDSPRFTALGARLDSPSELLEAVAALSTAANRNGRGLWRALEGAAAEDPAVKQVHQALVGRQRADCRRGIDRIAAAGALRADRTPTEAADLLYALVLPDLYDRLVTQAGWSLERYRQWLADVLAEQILAPKDREAATAPPCSEA
ncbi:MAG: hypothetical protein AVDCRST_MAG61-3067 [uncultured Friedmanniella sp.]|uniref:HTH tetR-type domain-containing protein n=1 Tax=uncultured Friedmanniella sp. TaxID=335381 RepID=A0A6J4LK35_9ACTN|nr:TetR/AcrR family transcriptional regulator [uncultured Friedmanniella sp.]CAA9333864.1 MAG: hypothetical protein AVDCRST_MAG61-3067 [uncultured Friedmanniella sp.]